MLSRFVVSQLKHNSYFLVGVGLGLWLALVAVPLGEEVACAAGGEALGGELVGAGGDDFEPQREERPLGSGGAAGRSVQRPRYYSTELGMRAPLLAAVLSSEDALGTRAAAINRTAARLQPALRFFITASALQAAPGLPNVVGFTDTREMLKPFHALKYLADNYLEEYDFFFLVSDTSFVNARRLTELVSKLSVSQDVYMGTVADGDSHYCSLEGGIILSNSVLRAVHAELDWCVRNSYSPHHHENLGRCVLHAAHQACTSALQGERYSSLREEAALRPALADAVTRRRVAAPARFHQLHAYVSRVFLERDAAALARLRAAARRAARRAPAGFRNHTWPAGLRLDPGLAPPPPDTRFDHLRWTLFNETHAFVADERSAARRLRGAWAAAVGDVRRAAGRWARAAWGARRVALLDAAWRWEPAAALRYRLLLRVTLPDRTQVVRQVEAVRPLGAARLVPVPYVTESARLHLVLPVRLAGAGGAGGEGGAARAFLARYEAACLRRAANTALYVVLMQCGESEATAAEARSLRDAVTALQEKHHTSILHAMDAADAGGAGEAGGAAGRCGEGGGEWEGGVALAAAARALPRDALVLLADSHMEFNDDFLNRVRMNTIAGSQWFLPVPFARYAQYAHPRFVDAAGRRPQVHTGRFNARHRRVLAFYRADHDAALAEWSGAGRPTPARALAASALRCLHAPEPGLVLAPRRAPCGLAPGVAPGAGACLAALRAGGLDELDLGAKHALAKMLLEMQADAA